MSDLSKLSLVNYEDLIDAISENNLTEVKKVHTNLIQSIGIGESTRAMDISAMRGYMNILIFLHENGHKASVWAMNWCAKGIYLKYLRWDDDDLSREDDSEKLKKSAEQCGLKVIKWLVSNRKEGCSKDAFYFAKEYKNELIYNFLCEAYPQIYERYLGIGLLKFSESFFMDKGKDIQLSADETIARIKETKRKWLECSDKETYRNQQLKSPYYPPLLPLWGVIRTDNISLTQLSEWNATYPQD